MIKCEKKPTADHKGLFNTKQNTLNYELLMPIIIVNYSTD